MMTILSLRAVIAILAAVGFSSATLATPAYWNLFNVEGESTGSAVYVTYASLIDMLTDSNRTGQYFPDNTGNAAANVVGSGAWIEPNGVPEPSTLWLLGSALLAHSIRRLSAVRALTPQEGSA